jgi:hypothetical protein
VSYTGNLKDLGQLEIHAFSPLSTSGSTYNSVTLKTEVARSSEASIIYTVQYSVMPRTPSVH